MTNHREGPERPEEETMPRLRALSYIVPEHRVTAEELSTLLLARAGSPSRVAEALDRATSPLRSTVLPLERLSRLAGIGKRSALYRQHATDLALRAVARLADQRQLDPRAIDKIIFVSGSGQATPSIDADIVRRFGLRSSCRRLSLAQLGCAGGTAALAMAAEMVRDTRAVALVVSAEVPSLQLPLAEPSLGELVAATQFGDGAAAAIVAGDGDGPEIFATASELLPEVGEGGTVLAHESGLRLRAAGDLPALIRKRVAPLLDGVLAPHGLAPRDLAFVAAHPRGAHVLRAIADGLALEPDQLAGSFTAFAKHGNTISASIFAVLAESTRRAMARDGRGTAALVAFGSGTSCEMAVLRWERAADLERIAQAAA
jgi:alkylresorcinol/alkylpyrone synthase